MGGCVASFESAMKVYVIDDDDGARMSLDSVLRSVGYDVELFETGYEFLASTSREQYGCIILDIRLPGPSGLEIQKRLLEAGIRMPVIFITGHGDIAMAVQAMKAQAIEFLTKPFRDQDVLDAISKADNLERTRKNRDAYDTLLQSLVEKLSPREREVFDLIVGGHLGKQIAFQLAISEATVKVHRRNIMSKLGIKSINELMQFSGKMSSTYAH
jgi:FixJ family two-component response regulator